MPSAEILSEEFRFMGLFVGPKHSGKTVALASFPKPMEILDFDGRVRGILGAPWIDRKGISYEPYSPLQKDLVKTIDQKLTSYQQLSIASQFHLKTGVIDSLTAEAYAFLTQGIKVTHEAKDKGGEGRGRYLGKVAMAGPEEYGYEAQTMYDVLAAYRSLPIPNVIATAHIVDKYGKEDPNDKYSPTVIVGEKLSLRDKIGVNVAIYFDHIFRFNREMSNGREKFTVQFRGDFACTSYASLPHGVHDITGLNFYDFMMSFIKNKENEGLPA